MELTSNSIFSYQDYRKFLGDYYRARKAHDAKFSQRFIQREVGVSSAGWFSDILSGRLNLQSPQLLRLAWVLRLKPGEEEYLALLVGFSRAASYEERERLYEQIRLMQRSEMKADPCLTLSLSARGLEQARRELENLKRRLLALKETDGEPDAVYRCSLRIDPLFRNLAGMNSTP
jgi:hypothetical protein